MRFPRISALNCLHNIHQYFNIIDSIAESNESIIAISQDMHNDNFEDQELALTTESSSDSGFIQYSIGTTISESNFSTIDLKIETALNISKNSDLDNLSSELKSGNKNMNTEETMIRKHFKEYFNNFVEISKSIYWAHLLIINKSNDNILPILNEALFPSKDIFIDILETSKRECILGLLCRLNITVDSNILKQNWLLPLSSIPVPNPVVDQHGVLINTGSFIRKISWAPRNPEVILDQFLAVSVYRELKERLKIYENIDKNEQMVQIYNCGQLKMNTREACLPILEMVFIHNWGKVADITWCPQPLPIQNTSEKLIGHLALCCSDGFIRIIPICKLQNPGCFVKLDKNHPVLCLGTIRQRGPHVYPITMHWRQEFPNRIIAGYNTGHVGLFVLENSVFASLSNIVEGNIYLKPSEFRKVFDSPCRSVQICPHNWQRAICSSYFEPNVIIIDFDQPSGRQIPTPIDCGHNISSQIFWPAVDNTIVLGTRKDLNNDSGILLCSPDPPIKQPMKLLLDDISVTEISHPLNVLTVGTRSGQFYIFHLKKINDVINKRKKKRTENLIDYQNKAIKESFYFRYHLNALNPTESQSSISTENVQNTDSLCKCPNTIYCVHKLIPMFSISINETAKIELNDWQLDSMVNVHEIAVNPNPGSAIWIAVGLECGLIHILPLTHFYRSEFDKLSSGTSCNNLNSVAINLSKNMFLNQSKPHKRGRPLKKGYLTFKNSSVISDCEDASTVCSTRSQNISNSKNKMNELNAETSSEKVKSLIMDGSSNVTTDYQESTSNKNKLITVSSKNRKKIPKSKVNKKFVNGKVPSGKKRQKLLKNNCHSEEITKFIENTKTLEFTLPDLVKEKSINPLVNTTKGFKRNESNSKISPIKRRNISDISKQVSQYKNKCISKRKDNRPISYSKSRCFDNINIESFKEKDIMLLNQCKSPLPSRMRLRSDKFKDNYSNSLVINEGKQFIYDSKTNSELKEFKIESESVQKAAIQSSSKDLNISHNGCSIPELSILPLTNHINDKEKSITDSALNSDISKQGFSLCKSVENIYIDSLNKGQNSSEESSVTRRELRSDILKNKIVSTVPLEKNTLNTDKLKFNSNFENIINPSEQKENSLLLGTDVEVVQNDTEKIFSTSPNENKIQNSSVLRMRLRSDDSRENNLDSIILIEENRYSGKSNQNSESKEFSKDCFSFPSQLIPKFNILNSKENVQKIPINKELKISLKQCDISKLNLPNKAMENNDFHITSDLRKQSAENSKKSTENVSKNICKELYFKDCLSEKSSPKRMKLRSDDGKKSDIHFTDVFKENSDFKNVSISSIKNEKPLVTNVKCDIENDGDKQKGTSLIVELDENTVLQSSTSKMRLRSVNLKVNDINSKSICERRLYPGNKRKSSDFIEKSTIATSMMSDYPKLQIVDSKYSISELMENKNNCSPIRTVMESQSNYSRKNEIVNYDSSKNSKVKIRSDNVRHNNINSTKSNSNLLFLNSSDHLDTSSNNVEVFNKNHVVDKDLTNLTMNFKASFPSEKEEIRENSIDSFEFSISRKGIRKIPRISSDSEESCDISFVESGIRNEKNLNIKQNKSLNVLDIPKKFSNVRSFKKNSISKEVRKSDSSFLSNFKNQNECDINQEICRRTLRSDKKVILTEDDAKCWKRMSNVSITPHKNEDVSKNSEESLIYNERKLLDQTVNFSPQFSIRNNVSTTQHVVSDSFISQNSLKNNNVKAQGDLKMPFSFKRVLKTDIDEEEGYSDQVNSSLVTLRSSARLAKVFNKLNTPTKIESMKETVSTTNQDVSNFVKSKTETNTQSCIDLKKSITENSKLDLSKNSVQLSKKKEVSKDDSKIRITSSIKPTKEKEQKALSNKSTRGNELELNLESVYKTVCTSNQSKNSSYISDKPKRKLPNTSKAKKFLTNENTADLSDCYLSQKENIPNNLSVNKSTTKSIDFGQFKPKLFSTPKTKNVISNVKEKSSSLHISNKKSCDRSLINKRSTKKVKYEKFDAEKVKKLHDIFAMKRQELFASQSKSRSTSAPNISCPVTISKQKGSFLNTGKDEAVKGNYSKSIHRKKLLGTDNLVINAVKSSETEPILELDQRQSLSNTNNSPVESMKEDETELVSKSNQKAILLSNDKGNADVPMSNERKKTQRLSWWGTDNGTAVFVNESGRDKKSTKILRGKRHLKKNSKSCSDEHMDKIKKVIGNVLSQSNGKNDSISEDCPKLLQPFRSLKSSSKNISSPSKVF